MTNREADGASLDLTAFQFRLPNLQKEMPCKDRNAKRPSMLAAGHNFDQTVRCQNYDSLCNYYNYYFAFNSSD